MTVKLTVNGKPRELAGPVSLLGFLESLGVNTQFVAVAYNGDVLDREQFPSITLKHGDELEVVRPVGGGEAGHTQDAHFS